LAKITRKTAFLFGVNAGVTGVEEFASKAQGGTLVYSTDPANLQTGFWTLGWTPAQFEGVFAPYYQDRNAVDLVASYQIAYVLQQGIAEWDSTTSYFIDSVVQSGGSFYISLQDNNLNNIPPAGASNSFWQRTAFPNALQAKSPTRTVLTIGSGTYTPPIGCARIFVRLVGGGGGGGCPAGGGAVINGAAGTATTFGGLTGAGGGGGQGAAITTSSSAGVGTGGAGGAASGGDVNIAGGGGGYGINTYNTIQKNGGGGSSKFGGGSRYINLTSTPNFIYAGISASANSGGGGQGGYFNFNYSGLGVGYPGGGGAGGYVEKTYYNPTAMSWAVGTGGAGAVSNGSFGGITPNGGAGAAGIIIIDEYYY
jgi:hypothetical protein